MMGVHCHHCLRWAAVVVAAQQSLSVVIVEMLLGDRIPVVLLIVLQLVAQPSHVSLLVCCIDPKLLWSDVEFPFQPGVLWKRRHHSPGWAAAVVGAQQSNS